MKKSLNTLKHLAIIMDGNGRWAKARSLVRTQGHKMGAKKIELLCNFCQEKNIKELSLFAFSTENINRPKQEVDFLFNLLDEYVQNQEEIFMQNNIFFNPFGDLSVFSDKLQKQLLNLQNKTQNHKSLIFNLGLNYGAKNEILNACKNVCKKVLDKEILLENIEKSDFENELFIKNPIDLLIRTGKQKRISNFLLYQLAYAEIYFSNTLFPDLQKDELDLIYDEFMKTERRFGRV